jgi:hypothetical protein
MDKSILSAVSQVVSAIADNDASRAAKYLSEKLVVRGSRPVFGPKGKRRILKGGNISLVLTIGRPNHEQREFIRKCKKAGEPFPVKKVQLKFPPKSTKK